MIVTFPLVDQRLPLVEVVTVQEFTIVEGPNSIRIIGSVEAWLMACEAEREARYNDVIISLGLAENAEEIHDLRLSRDAMGWGKQYPDGDTYMDGGCF